MKKSKKFSDHTDALAADWENIKDAFAETADDVTDLADDMCDITMDNLKSHTDDIQQNVIDYTLKNPIRTIAIALAAGLIIGWYLKK